MKTPKRHRGIFLAEAVVALAVLCIIVTVLDVAIHQKMLNSRRLEDSRTAMSIAEQTLTALQTGAPRPAVPAGAVVTIRRLPISTSSPGLPWADVQVQFNSERRNLIGLIRAKSFSPGAAP